MGCFSWLTEDTRESILIKDDGAPHFTVHMFDNQGNVWTEENYEGYGEFGGKDFYVLLAEMNGIHGEARQIRARGIHLAHSELPHLSPSLARSKSWGWHNTHPENCPNQGFYSPET